MKALVFVAAICAAGAVFSAGTNTVEAKNAVLAKNGGMIVKPGEGKLVVVNCQTKIPATNVSERATRFVAPLRVPIEVREGSWKFGDGRPADANAALFVVDDPALPMSLVAAEERWGVVNVAKLDVGPRFNRQFLRSAILTFGAAHSQQKGSPMRAVTKPEDLDAFMSEDLMFDTLISVGSHLKGIGVTPNRLTSYRRACKEGWAPAPTNDFQKVVWEEVHAKPTNPMKIKFDPKKGE